MPKPDSSLTAVIVSGGKQYRVGPGDHLLVDRLAAEPGSEFAFEQVLLVADGPEVKVGAPTVSGVVVAGRVLRHTRGPKIDVLRYKSKKRVRVHRGARADLTAVEIVDIGGKGSPAAGKVVATKGSAAKRKAPAADSAEDVDGT